MTKTIEERLTNIRGLQRRVSSGAEQAEGDALIAAVAAIIADWNAAVEAMKAEVFRVFRESPSWSWYCEGYKAQEDVRPERHTPETCPVAALQAALALMEGNSHSHSRDEAMVEDKRYERDEIYKK